MTTAIINGVELNAFIRGWHGGGQPPYMDPIGPVRVGPHVYVTDHCWCVRGAVHDDGSIPDATEAWSVRLLSLPWGGFDTGENWRPMPHSFHSHLISLSCPESCPPSFEGNDGQVFWSDCEVCCGFGYVPSVGILLDNRWMRLQRYWYLLYVLTDQDDPPEYLRNPASNQRDPILVRGRGIEVIVMGCEPPSLERRTGEEAGR